MADPLPKKPLDRDRPFKRINNKQFLKDKQPDGLGKACGCHTPEDLGAVDKEFLDFLDRNLPVPIIKIFETIEDVAKTIANAARKLSTALAIIAPLALALKIPIIGLLALIGAAAALLDMISSTIETVVGIIKDVVKKFFGSIGKRILQRALRVIPQWVPVTKGASNRLVGADQLVEMEGIATRSFGNPVDVPFFQWHRWFDWNIQVTPEPDYANALSPVGDPPNTADGKGGERPITKSGAFEIQVDPGILWAAEKAAEFESLIKEPAIEGIDGPMMDSDLCWPQAGMFVWAAGRWVYDCSRVSGETPPRMCAMINPAKAIATARFKAARLSGQAHGLSVPVIQFMFIATKQGGYIDFDSVTDRDYEFIVDLPPAPELDLGPYPIAHTGKIPHNTIVLRPRLLQDLLALPRTDAELIEPIVEPIFGDDPTKPPQQVKVTVPMTKAKKPKAGFILTMGWFDPNFELAAKVKECTVAIERFSGRLQVRDNGVATLRQIFAKEEAEMRQEIIDRVDNLELPLPNVLKAIGIKPKVKDIGPLRDLAHEIVNGAIDAVFKAMEGAAAEREEWLLRFGLNGEWLNVYDNTIKDGDAVRLRPLKRPANFTLLRLGEDDALSLSVHGTEYNPVGDMMRATHRDRILNGNDGAVAWPTFADPAFPLDKWKDLVFHYALRCLTDTTSGTGKMALGLENNPLGLIDPDPGTAGDAPAANNPIRVKSLADGTFPIRRTAQFARAAGDQCILLEDPGKQDFVVEGTLTVKKQDIKTS